MNLCEIVWYSQCVAHIVLALSGLVWLTECDQTVSTTVWLTVLLSMGLDWLIAGSEVFHRVRLHLARLVHSRWRVLKYRYFVQERW